MLSRLVYRKGVDLQVAAIPELCRRHARLRFLIGGDGPKRADLEAMVHACGLGERVRLVGSVRHAAVRDLLVQGARRCCTAHQRRGMHALTGDGGPQLPGAGCPWFVGTHACPPGLLGGGSLSRQTI